QVEHLQEELFLQGRPAGDRGGPAGSCEHRQQRDDDHAGQGMPPVDGRAWILQFLKMDDDLVERDTLKFGHVSPPGAAVVEATPGKVYTKSIQGGSFTVYQDYP